MFGAQGQAGRVASAAFLTTLLTGVQKWGCWFGDQIEDYEKLYRDLVQDGVAFPPCEPKQLIGTVREKTELATKGKRRCPASFLFVACYQVKTYHLCHSDLPDLLAALRAYHQLLSQCLKDIRQSEPQSYSRVLAALDLLTSTLQLRPAPSQSLPAIPPPQFSSIPQEPALSLDFSLVVKAEKQGFERSIVRESISFREPDRVVLDLQRPPEMPRLEEVNSDSDSEVEEDTGEAEEWGWQEVRAGREEFVGAM